MNSVHITMKIDTGRKPVATVIIDTEYGPDITCRGSMYPIDWEMVRDIVEVLKKYKDRFPAHNRGKKNATNRQDQEPESSAGQREA